MGYLYLYMVFIIGALFSCILRYFAERLRDYKGILQKMAYVILEVLFAIVFMFTMIICFIAVIYCFIV